jgi:molybdopterin-guanine dinucleotide biosynthesis protein
VLGAHGGGSPETAAGASEETHMFDVIIQVSGKEHTGKTSIIAAIALRLEELGVTVTLQRIDPQLDDKLTMDDRVLERLKSTNVFIQEMRTPG